ncbi:polysaccharide deacetylase family protein [Nitrospira sp. NS4]|uniref:polysaccharide deacetylase family protein n=1 Tax=Nitrospira sp. NS4 TaxID=3414498 RepID=UPI003C2D3CDD
MKHAIKYAVSHMLYAVGLLQLWQFVVLRRRAVILMYHRVLTPEQMCRSGSHPAIMVDCETFAEQMAVVKRRFKVLSIEEFADRMERKSPFESSSCLITFDDGWQDNFTNALPVLRRYELPALVFLPVNFIGRNRLFWQEALVHLLVLAVRTVRREPAREVRIREALDPIGLAEVLDLNDSDPRSRIIETISRNRAGLTPSLVDTALANLRSEFGVENGDVEGTDSFMNWEQIAEMSRHGIAFGGHGSEHRLLSEMPIEEAREDIRMSKEVFDVRCKGMFPTFSYPRGYWTPQVAESVRAAGFRLAFLAKGGSVSCEDDPFTIRRVNICQAATESMPMFLARVVGLF